MKREAKFARIAIGIICLALIRTTAEPLRIEWMLGSDPHFAMIKPFIWASLVTFLGLIGMVLFYYFGKYRISIGLAILIIMAMIAIKILWIGL